MADRPTFETSSRAVTVVEADLLALPVFEGPSPGPGVTEVGRALGRDLGDLLRQAGFRGQPGESLVISGGGALAARNVLLLGMGPQASMTTQVVRESAMRAGAASRHHPVVATTLAQLGGPPEASAHALAEGFLLGVYRFDRYKREREPRSERVIALGSRATAVTRGLDRGRILGSAANWARDLTNMPAAEATPSFLAAEARRMATEVGVEAKLWTKADLERGGFGGVLGVGAGSEHDPCMVELTYARGRGKPVAITGKGITFDSGGLSLKRRGMESMRSDMGGAAAALATVRAVAELGLKVNLVAAVAFAENMPGASATRPGDVLTHRGGRTSEVADTDAEGRVLLADMLAYLCEKGPSVLLDSGTLTDAGGLGADLWAVMGTDRALAAELVRAGEEGGDHGWELPLWTSYRKLIDSDVADVKNVGEHWSDSSVMCGLFLRDFVADGVPWLHLDTGSSAWAEHPTDLWPEGATSSPTRAFVRFIARRAGRPLP